MRILISGASGFIGKPLAFYLASQGHTVVRLVRASKEEPNTIVWDPDAAKANPGDFEGFDAVVHLAGEPLSMTRWTKKKKERILYSRTIGTFFLSHILSKAIKPPHIFISSSAFGFYGDRGDELLTETSEAGRGFLANVCCEWEKATHEIEKRGSRVVHARFGLVLGPNGGILKRMLAIYRLGLGGRIGSGQQWISWIALYDLVRSIGHILTHPSLDGPVNIVSPHPVRQKDFSKTLAHLLHRPAIFPLPAWLVRLVFGQMGDEMLLSSARVSPTKLLATNYNFHYPDLQGALQKAH